MIAEPDVKHILEKIRGIFPDRAYVGGSFAMSKYLPGINYDDIDIFITGNRSMETWALVSILNSIFDKVITSNLVEYYKIVGQYLFLQCYYKDRKYDLIFIKDGINVASTCGSTLSQLFFKLNYSETMLAPVMGNREIVTKLLIDRKCLVWESMCTDSYLDKTIQKCKNLDIRIKYV